jgi:hypothetical protein
MDRSLRAGSQERSAAPATCAGPDQAAGTPSAGQYRHALRQVVGRCIYGVDLNPMAVELCRVSLWMETVEPGRPLSFLDSHIQRGNALLGTTPELMKNGVPDAAWDPIEGDDKKTAMAEVMRSNGQLPVASGDKPLTTRYSPLASSSYQTRLDPPPADPRVAHPDTRGAKR